MTTASKQPKLTITIKDQDLSEAIRQTAADRNQTPREIILEALKKWLKEEERQEMREDAALAREAREDAEPIMDFDQYVAERQKRA